MNDTATHPTFTKYEYDFLFDCILAENNRQNRNVMDGKASKSEWEIFIYNVKNVLPKLQALTETNSPHD